MALQPRLRILSWTSKWRRISTLKFRVDPGQYCLKVQFLDAEGNPPVDKSLASVDIKGKMWSNQAFGGLFGLISLTLSIFAFMELRSKVSTLRNCKCQGKCRI